jgi:hypothetical protein
LQALLADPQMAPLIAVPSVRRLLNPLCQMLGIPKPPPPQAPPPRPTSAPPPPRPHRDSETTPVGCHPPPQTAPVAA